MVDRVDDVHNYNSGLEKAKKRLKNLDTSEHNKEVINKFVKDCRLNGLQISTVTNYLNILQRLLKRLNNIGISKDIDKLDKEDFDELLIYLIDEVNLSDGEIRNYKKAIKKLYNYLYEDEEPPRWVKKLKLGKLESSVQPSDLPADEDINKLIDGCDHPRDKAIVSMLTDSGLRIGALLSLKIKNIEMHQNYAYIYISKTSQSRKTSEPKGVPVTWSLGYLNQWLNVHPYKEDVESPLWLTLDKNRNPLNYKSARLALKKAEKNAGLKGIHHHLLRHKAISTWILQGYSEQEIKHMATLSKSSNQILKIYSNFTDAEINEQILKKQGVISDTNKKAELKWCSRCNNALKPDDRLCPQCGLVQDQKTLSEIDKYNSKLPDILKIIMDSEKGRELISELKDKDDK